MAKHNKMDKIITSYDYPPIPIRDYDWSAIREDYEPGDLIGTGRTEQDAIDDLVRQENERQHQASCRTVKPMALSGCYRTNLTSYEKNPRIHPPNPTPKGKRLQ